MTDERPTMGQDEVYGFYRGQPTVGVMLWDGTNDSTVDLIADLVKFCELRGARVVSAHARVDTRDGRGPHIELTIQYPERTGPEFQDFILRRYDALVLFSIHEKIVFAMRVDERDARQIIEVGPPTIILGVDPGADTPMVVAEKFNGQIRILES